MITGGASGIGFATARELGLRGARIVIGDIEERALDQAVDRLSALGIDALGVRCDVTRLEDVQHLADEAFRHLEAVHILFNNAGVAVAGPIAEMTPDDWRWIIDVELWGPIHGVEAFLPRLQQQGQGGHILFTSSFAGLVPNVGLGPYCVAKYGVVALAEVLVRELKADGSRSTAVTVATPTMRTSTPPRTSPSSDTTARPHWGQAGRPPMVRPMPRLRRRKGDGTTPPEPALAA